MRFDTPGNVSNDDYFTRTSILSYTPGYWPTKPYVPEIQGTVTAVFSELHVLNSITRSASTTRFRLPGEEDIASQQFDIEYILTSRNYSVNGMDKTVTVSDTYDYIGVTAYEDAIQFSATVSDVGADAVLETINVLLESNMPNDDLTQLEFKIRNRKTIIDAIGE